MTSTSDVIVTVDATASVELIGNSSNNSINSIPDPPHPAIVIFAHIKDLVFPVQVENPKKMWLSDFKKSLVEQSIAYTSFLTEAKFLRQIEIVHTINNNNGDIESNNKKNSKKPRQVSSFDFSDEYDDVKHLELFSRCHVTINILTEDMMKNRIKKNTEEEEEIDSMRKCINCLLWPFKAVYYFFYYLFKCFCCVLEVFDD